MATINNTQYDEIELTIQRQADRLNHSLWSSTISPEALEQKLAQRRFSEAEKSGDYRRATRLHELSKMADTCIEVALSNALQ